VCFEESRVRRAGGGEVAIVVNVYVKTQTRSEGDEEGKVIDGVWCIFISGLRKKDGDGCRRRVEVEEQGIWEKGGGGVQG
jgi:hypothetical protein